MLTEKDFSQETGFLRPVLKDLNFSLLNEGRPICVMACGASMYPFVKNGDRIKIDPLKKEDIVKIGDIVAINRNDADGPSFLVHRVVKIINQEGMISYITKGDHAESGLDPAVGRDLIVGKIAEIKRGNIWIRLQRPHWRYLNPIIAEFSFRYSRVLNFLSGYISLIMEWRLLLDKIARRIQRLP